VVREAFKDLLKGWARSRDLIFAPEYEIATPARDRRYLLQPHLLRHYLERYTDQLSLAHF